jgi:hypothetical protein
VEITIILSGACGDKREFFGKFSDEKCGDFGVDNYLGIFADNIDTECL